MAKKKLIKYGLLSAVVLLVLYNSVYFRTLSDVRADLQSRQFDPVAYAKNFWNNELANNLDKAIEINYLVDQLQSQKEVTFETYSNALGIGNIRYFMVQGIGKVESIGENDVTLITESGYGKKTVKIATEYIFGNAVRDASGLIDINDFTNTMDFNNISAEINKIIRNTVIPPFRENLKEGDLVGFSGAIELNREHLNLEQIEVVPMRLDLKNNPAI